MKKKRKYFVIPIMILVAFFICDNIFGGIYIPVKKIFFSLFSGNAGGICETEQNFISRFADCRCRRFSEIPWRTPTF